MTDAELFKILRPIIITVTGVNEVILADPNAPAPTGTYAAVRPRQSVSERGQANIYHYDLPESAVRTDVRAQIVARCDINFYRGDAMLYAEKLKECHKRDDVRWTLFKNKIGWAGTEPVNNLTALQASNWEPRAQITVKLWYESSTTVDVNNIEQVTVSIQNEEGNTLRTEDIP